MCKLQCGNAASESCHRLASGRPGVPALCLTPCDECNPNWDRPFGSHSHSGSVSCPTVARSWSDCLSRPIFEAVMFAMLCRHPNAPLEWTEVPDPRPDDHQVLIRVLACGVCRTDLHLVDGELPDPKLPVIPGHEIVGEVVAKGTRVGRFQVGERVGVPWLGWTCGCARSARRDARISATARASPATRSTAATPRRPSPTSATAFAIAGGYSDVACGTAALRRPDRLRAPAHGGRRRDGSASTASAPPRTSWPRSRARGTRGLRVHAPRRRGRAGVRAEAWVRRGPARPMTRRPAARRER